MGYVFAVLGYGPTRESETTRTKDDELAMITLKSAPPIQTWSNGISGDC